MMHEAKHTSASRITRAVDQKITSGWPTKHPEPKTQPEGSLSFAGLTGYTLRMTLKHLLAAMLLLQVIAIPAQKPASKPAAPPPPLLSHELHADHSVTF